MSPCKRIWAFCVLATSLLLPPAVFAQSASARGVAAATAMASLYQDDYAYWRQQVRVASPSRQARWDAAPRGAVRVYHRRFDARWTWRSAPRHRVFYTYYRGDLWFLDPTTGWAWSVDQYGIVYTADPYRGWVYSLGPLTRWTADLLYFFDLYRFDRGYWYCADYDYFVDLWEGNSRRDFYSYDTAYSTLWGWEPYWRSPTFVSFSIQFTNVWVGQVRRHYDYIERNPHYRRELINSIGLPAVQAAPPHQMSPRAVTTSAYWEARDLAAAGLVPPPRGRDTGRNWQAGTVVDTREAPSNVVEPGAPAPGFNAPFPDGRYGAGEGRAKPDRPMARDSAAPPQFDEPTFTPPAQKPDDPTLGIPSVEAGRGSRGRDDGRLDAPRPKPDGWVRPDEPRYEPAPRDESRYQSAPREEPKFEPPVVEKPRYEPAPREEPRYEPPQREEPRYDPPPPREEPKHDPPPPREEPKYDPPPREEPKDDREPE